MTLDLKKMSNAKHPLSYETEETCHKKIKFLIQAARRKQRNYLKHSNNDFGGCFEAWKACIKM
jgi:hypothetical protein